MLEPAWQLQTKGDEVEALLMTARRDACCAAETARCTRQRKMEMLWQCKRL